MSLKSYAKLLGITPNEGGLIYKKDIRVAYLHLAKQLHPDKSQTNAGQFVEIKEAYDKLMEACKENEFAYVGGETDFEFDALVGLVQGLAAKLKKHFDIHKSEKKYQSQSTSQPQTPVPSTDIRLRVTIQELYIGSWKKIKYKYLAEDQQFLTDEVYICLESYQDEYVFPGKGDQLQAKRVDLRVIIDIIPDYLLYVDNILTRHDVCMTFTVSLYDYYCRDMFIIEYFEELVEINYSAGLTLQTIPNKGLPYIKDGVPTRGDLVVFFKLVLPPTVSNDIKPILEKHFVLPPVPKSEEELQTT